MTRMDPDRARGVRPVENREPLSPTSPPPRRRSPGGDFVVPLLVFALVVAVGLVGIRFADRVTGTDNDTAALAPAPGIGRPAPPGWAQQYVWVEEISAVDRVSVGHDRVAFINANGSLVVLDANSGQLSWSSSPQVISRGARPLVGVAGTRPVAAIVDDTSLLVWPLDLNGQHQAPESLSLPAGALVSRTGETLLVTSPAGSWRVTEDLALEPVPLDVGEAALAAGPEGVVTAAASGGWRIRGPQGRAVEPARPSEAIGEPHPAWSTRGVVLVWWESPDPAQQWVSLHATTTGELLAAHVVDRSVVDRSLPLSVSPGTRLASAGPLLVDLDTGDVTVDRRWSTTVATDDALYGTRDGVKAAWDSHRVTDVPDETALPWGVTTSGSAIVLDRTADGATMLGALARA